MCTRIRGIQMGPGSVATVDQLGGRSVSIWGFGNGTGQYNARSERLDTLYKKYDRGIIQMESFWEGTAEFRDFKNRDFHIAVILNKNNEFVILTRPANSLVKPYHLRHPLIIDPMKDNEFLKGKLDSSMYLDESMIILKTT